MAKYEVEVRVTPSKGGFAGETKKVVVEARDVADAIVQATLKLDDEGHDRFTLVRPPCCIEN